MCLFAISNSTAEQCTQSRSDSKKNHMKQENHIKYIIKMKRKIMKIFDEEIKGFRKFTEILQH
jgi:hypothetical protein